ncbi:MAG: phosphatidylserine decarboxylase family protein [Flavobacteriia bacterium]|nr:phosphatidylserine decarboxylase family protein [Candidatus Bostrichicola ureolyticus]
MIHKEGYLILINTLLFIIIISIIINIFYKKLLILSIVIFSIIYIFLLWFFRNPKINIGVIKQNEIVSPADGKIIKIKKIFENKFFNDFCIQISIFMSPLNVHVNRYPISGKIIYIKYFPGKHFIAFYKKSSSHNERTIIVIKSCFNKQLILLKQIAGIIARRIICYSKIGDITQAGKEFGFIKLGSRVDLILPLNVLLKVKEKQKITGGKTILAILKK